MEKGIFGALADRDFWSSVGQRAMTLPGSIAQTLQEYGRIPGRADDIAERTFPGSARDASTKNAFRHALGTGMLAQELGGGHVGATLAKMAGYGWEGLGLIDGSNRSPAKAEDMRHDLNANAIGAEQARLNPSHEDLVQALKKLALQSAPVSAPGVFSRSPGYLTRTAQ
jgi:hypothetical protein